MKPLSPEATAELNAVLQRAVERMERRRKMVRIQSTDPDIWLKADKEAEQLAAAVADLSDELARVG